MNNYTVRVIAETNQAFKNLDSIDKKATAVERDRNINFKIPSLDGIGKGLDNIEKEFKAITSGAGQAYEIMKKLPNVKIMGVDSKEVIGRIEEVKALGQGIKKVAEEAPVATANLVEQSKAANILKNSYNTASDSINNLLLNTAKIGFAMFAVKEAVGVVQAAFSGLFNNTIGREIQLRQTILQTQTTLASTNKVFDGTKEITDSYEKIVGLTGTIEARIDSIRARSIDLAGVTSNDVIQVFGILLGQISQVGGSLKDAEDLAISFSAALGTFGIPLYQARQEVGSILRGDITMDSYLAKSLGITNKDIADARTKTGGVVKFLEDKLSSAVAGQKIAAQGFSGITSNIADIGEIVGQRFGAGLLDPLLGGLSKVYDILSKNKELIFDIAGATGGAIGSVFGGLGTRLMTESTVLNTNPTNTPQDLLKPVSQGLDEIKLKANDFITPLRRIFDDISKSIIAAGEGLSKLAVAFARFSIAGLEATVTMLANLATIVPVVSGTFGNLLEIYAKLLDNPIGSYFAQIGAQMGILDRIGAGAVVKLIFAGAALQAAWKPVIAFFQKFVADTIVNVNKLIAFITNAVQRIGNIITALGTTIDSMRFKTKMLSAEVKLLGASMQSAADNISQANQKMTTAAALTEKLQNGIRGAIIGFAKANLLIFAVTFGMNALVDMFGRFQRAQEEAQNNTRMQQAISDLSGKYADLSDNVDTATRKQADYARSLVDTRYTEIETELLALEKTIAQAREDYTKDGINSIQEFAKNAQTVIEQLGLSLINPTLIFDTDTTAAQQFKDAQSKQLDELSAKEKELRAEKSKLDQLLDKERLEKAYRIEANNAVNIQKEIEALRREQENTMFGLRQQLAQRELQTYKLIEDLRIQNVNRYNAKLLEGQKGNALAALTALNDYINTKEQGELSIEMAKREIIQQTLVMEKAIADYKYETEKKIAELAKRVGDFKKQVADYEVASAKLAAEAAAGRGDTSSGTAFTGPLEQLAKLITGVESGSHGTYQAMNTGGSAGGTVAHGSADSSTKYPGGLIAMTVGEVMKKQAAGEIHAAGRWQIIGKTLAGLVERGVIKRSDQFDQATQDKAFLSLLGGRINRYLGGQDSVGQAAQGLRNEWVGLQKVPIDQIIKLLQSIERSGGIAGNTVARGTAGINIMPRDIEAATKATASLTGNTVACALAVKKFMEILGVNSSVMDATAASANRMGTVMKDWSKLKPGDIVARGSENDPRHVGVYTGGDKVFHHSANAGYKSGEYSALGYFKQDGYFIRPDSSGGTRTGPPTLAEPNLDLTNLGEVSAKAFEDAQRQILAATKRANEVQADIAKANTKEKLEAIIPRLFPKQDFDDLDTRTRELKDNLKILGDTKAEAYDSDEVLLTIQRTTERNNAERTYTKFLEGTAKAKNLDAAARKKLEDDAKKARDQELIDIDKGIQKRREILSLERAKSVIESINSRIQQDRQNQVQAELSIRAQLAKLFVDPRDIRANRRIDTELAIATERASFTKGELNDPIAAAAFEARAEVLRANTEALATLEEELRKNTEKLALAKELSGSVTGGFKSFAADILRGGDFKQAAENMLQSISSKFLEKGLEYAFKPLEAHYDKLFKDLLGLKDPVVVSTDKNTTQTDLNTAALNANTAALAKPAIDTNAAALATPALPPSTEPVTVPITVVPAGTTLPTDTVNPANAAVTQLNTNLQEASTAIEPLKDGGDALNKSLTNTTPAFSQLQQTVGQTVGVLTTVAMGIAGVAQMGKGGTYNTLMGLSGIFGAIGGIASMFSGGGGIGSLFGGRATGGRFAANTPYYVGEKGTEIAMFDQPGFMVNNNNYKDLLTNKSSKGSANNITKTKLMQQLRYTNQTETTQKILSALSSTAIKVELDTTTVNNMELATTKQLEISHQRAVSQAQAKIMGALQNSTAVRRKLGIS